MALGACFCFSWLWTVIRQDCPRGLLCLPPHGDLPLEKKEERPGETAPSLWIEIQLGSTSTPSVRLSCLPFLQSCFLLALLQPWGLKPTPAGFQGPRSRDEIEFCCDMPKYAFITTFPWLGKNIYPILSCHAMPCHAVSPSDGSERENLLFHKRDEKCMLQFGGKIDKNMTRKNSAGYAVSFAFFGG